MRWRGFSLRERCGSSLNIVRRSDEALLIARRIRKKGMLAVHDLLKIASISKIESDEILGLPECDCLIRQFAGKLNKETRVLAFSVFESGVNLLVIVLVFDVTWLVNWILLFLQSLRLSLVKSSIPAHASALSVFFHFPLSLPL